MSVIDLFRSRKRPADRFEHLVSPHIDGLYRFAYRLCQNADDAEDIVQLLLTKLYPKLDQLEGLESIKPWLMRSLYNLYVDHYRRTQRHLAVITTDEIPDTARTEEPSPHQNVELSQQQTIIMNAVNQLNDDQRVVLLLHDADGYSLPEITDILQVPIGTLKSRLHRGRNRVKDLTEGELSDTLERVSSNNEVV